MDLNLSAPDEDGSQTLYEYDAITAHFQKKQEIIALFANKYKKGVAQSCRSPVKIMLLSFSFLPEAPEIPEHGAFIFPSDIHPPSYGSRRLL